MDTLSAVMRRENIETVQLLKIDVEGDELNVLMGIESDLWPRIQQANDPALTPNSHDKTKSTNLELRFTLTEIFKKGSLSI